MIETSSIPSFAPASVEIQPSARRWPLVGLVALLVVIRVGAWLLLAGTFAFEQTGVVQGFGDYDLIARNILTDGTFGVVAGEPYASVAPLYPYLLAGLYGVFGRSSLAVVLMNTTFDAITVLLIVAIGSRLFSATAGRIVGLIAALCFVVYPYFTFQALTVIDTSLFTVLLHTFVYLTIRLAERARADRITWALVALTGVVYGLTILARPLGAMLGLAALLWFVVRGQWRAALLRLAPVAILGVLVITPWNVRNYALYNTFVNIGTHMGMNFWFGNSEYVIPFFRAGYHTQWATPQMPDHPLNQLEADRYLFNLGLSYLREHPEQIPELMLVKLWAYWTIEVFPTRNPIGDDSAPASPSLTVSVNDQGQMEITGVAGDDALIAYSSSLFDQVGRAVHRVYFGGLLALALVGVALTRRQWRTVSLLWLVQIVMTAAYVIFSGPTTRYRVPTDPLLFLFSAATLAAAWSALRRARSRTATSERAA